MSEVILQPDDILLDIHEVKNIIGLSPTTINEMRRKGIFPQPVLLHRRAVRWVESEVRAWMVEKIKTCRVSTGAGAA